MTPEQFTTAIAATRMAPLSRTTQAAYAVLVNGLSQYAAAREIGVNIRAVSRAVTRLQLKQRCPHCHGSGYFLQP